jgi:hypothetical protein
MYSIDNQYRKGGVQLYWIRIRIPLKRFIFWKK